MAIDGDLSDPIYQVRVIIGDIVVPYFISDSVLQYILTANDDDIHASAVEAVKYLVSYFSRLFDQEVGDVRFKWSELRDNYKDLLDDLISDPTMGGTMVVHILGGTDLTEIKRVKNANVYQSPVQIGLFSEVPKRVYNSENPYLSE